MRGSIRQRAIARATRATFDFWQRLGIHVTPVQYLQPVPDTRRLDPALWERRSALVGIDLDESRQLALLQRLRDRWSTEYSEIPRASTGDPRRYYIDNRSFESVDGEILYAMLRELRPRRMIEIGSGLSTLLAAQALRANASEETTACEYVAIDPFPIYGSADDIPGLTRIVTSPVELVPLGVFERLGAGDILFIDSSHVLRIGSDVQYLFLELIPRLAPGVYVHVHDIFLPSEYPKEWVLRLRRFWTEQYLLQAFLTFNAEWEVIWAGHYMHLTHPEALAEAFPSYGPSRSPGSFWMRRVGASAMNRDAVA